MKFRCIVTFVLITIATLASGQNFSISGSVKDDNSPISFATILLYEIENDTPLKGTSTNEEGFFEIKEVPTNTYKLTISYVGFNNFEETFTLSENKNFGTINLQKTTEDLEETVVTAKNQLLKKQQVSLFLMWRTPHFQPETLLIC